MVRLAQLAQLLLLLLPPAPPGPCSNAHAQQQHGNRNDDGRDQHLRLHRLVASGTNVGSPLSCSCIKIVAACTAAKGSNHNTEQHMARRNSTCTVSTNTIPEVQENLTSFPEHKHRCPDKAGKQ
jgi:hypothetical protein